MLKLFFLRSMKGHDRFYNNNVQGQNFTSGRPTTNSPMLPSTSHPSARENCAQKHFPQLSKKENRDCIHQSTNSCTEKRASKESSVCHSKSLSTLQNESDKHKSKHRDEKYQCLKPFQSPLNIWRHRTGSDSNRDSSAADKTRAHKVDSDTKRNYDSRTCISKTYLSTEGHHRLDRAKSPRQAILDNTAKTGRNRELRQDKAKLLISDSEHGSACSSKKHFSSDSTKSYKCDRGSNSKDQKRFSSNQNSKKYKDSYKDREGDRLSKNYQKKDMRRHVDEVRKYKRNSRSETSKESRKQRAKELDRSDVSNKAKEKNKHGTAARSSNITEKESMARNTPNKKLCFMETLNLTLSPIKKLTVPMDDSQNEPPGYTVHYQSDDENSQTNAEDMCIIDEIGSCQSEDIAEQTSIIPEHKTKSYESVKDFQKETTNYNISEVEKPPDNSVKTTSAHNQALDMAKNQVTEDLTANSQQNSPIKPQSHENRTVPTSESQRPESAPLEATHSTCRSISKWHTSSSLEQGNLVINADQPVAIIEPFVLKSKEEKPPKTTVCRSFPVDGPTDSVSKESPIDVPDCFKSQGMHPTVLPQSCQQGLSAALIRSVYNNKEIFDVQGDPKETEAVSSMISVESFPRECLSLPEAIHILTEANEDMNNSLALKLSSSTSCTGVTKVSSATEDLVVPKRYSELNFTQNNCSPAKSSEGIVEPSSSVLLLHDEDSMMQTLNNLKGFPNAISPLRSPIRITKRSHLHIQVNPGHVKSPQTGKYERILQ